MKLWSDSFSNGGVMPTTLAFGKHHPENHVELCENRNPQLAWSDLPAGTRSLAVVCIDSDAPSSPENVNQEGKSVSADLPRVSFSHWALVDLAPDATIAEGAFSDGITPKGKGPESPHGTRHGLNDYTMWFAGDSEMGGSYFGYDGACPPWNDEIAHHYRFTLYALDCERCPVEGEFGAQDVLKAIEGHVLGQAELVGTYAINPDARILG